MTTRFSPVPVGTLNNGYDNQNVSDVFIPSCGLEDVDVSIFNLFEKELRFYTIGNETTKESNQKKVPVIFAAGEKWAMLKKGQPLRDKTGALILPLITVMRTGVEQTFASDIVGRGINQQTGTITIRRKLDKSDRAYQNLINRLNILNQNNVAINPGSTSGIIQSQPLTDREVGDLAEDIDILNGAIMKPNRLNNVYETLIIPAPQFFSAKYEITFWTQYTQQMNVMMETFMSSFLPQGRTFKLTTHKGYWFVAHVEETYQQENNFEDMSQQERIIKQKFTINVPAYVLASNSPGVPIPVRRYVSSPLIKFSTNLDPTMDPNFILEQNGDSNYQFLGADDPTLPMQNSSKPKREDYRDDSKGILGTSGTKDDPALLSYRRGNSPGQYVRIGNKLVKVTTKSTTTGETTYLGADFDKLNIIISD